MMFITVTARYFNTALCLPIVEEAINLIATVPPLFADRKDVHFPYGWVTA
jgi:hypothetical protein